MTTNTIAAFDRSHRLKGILARGAIYLPGIGLAMGVTGTAFVISVGTAYLSAAAFHRSWTPPVMALSLVIGIFAHPLVSPVRFGAGLAFTSTTLLRGLVAMLGLRIALGDLAHLGLELAAELVAAMALTIAVTVCLARRFSCSAEIAAMMGAANAVCGAAAALAAASTLPRGSCTRESVALTIVLANAASTLAMMIYPQIGFALGLSALQVGVLAGASIQDVAQVVGAGLALPPDAGNAAISVKMFRVLMLMPVMASFAALMNTTGGSSAIRYRMPAFAVAFVIICLLNSAALAVPGFAAVYEPLRGVLIQFSGLGLLVAISAVGLQTSLAGLRAQGLRPVALFAIAALVMLGCALLLAARHAA